jgi:hypothetical protein
MNMENVNELATALAKAQGSYKPIRKNCTGKVTYPPKDGRPGGNYEFEYADLQAVIEATRDGLSANGLCHFATINEGVLTVTLLHSSGQSLSSSEKLPDPADCGWQKYGSAITYSRRYQLAPLLGVASEDDDDGNHAEGNQLSKQERRPVSPVHATKEQVAELNAALMKLFPNGTAEEKVTAKLAWVNGFMPHGRSISKFGDLLAEEMPRLIASAIAGEIPQAETPPWMGK